MSDDFYIDLLLDADKKILELSTELKEAYELRERIINLREMENGSASLRPRHLDS